MINRLRLLQAQAGLTRLSLPKLLLVTLLAVGLLVLLLLKISSSPAITLCSSLCVVIQAADSLKTRIRKLAWQENLDWPKYLDAIYSSAWAGTSLQQALLDCRGFAPAGSKWAILELERDLLAGMSFADALQNMKNRLANPIADRFVEITRLAHLSGGRGYLAALRSQSLQLRQENATWQEIEVKQSWVVASARMAVYAPWLVLLLLTLRPETAEIFSSSSGVLVLTIGLVSTIGAFQLIRQLGTLPKRRRVLGG